MADPSEKSLPMGMFLEELSGRTSSIHDNRCIEPPFGCGGEAREFRDELSAREYRISGLCQQCQDAIFGVEDEDNEEDNEYASPPGEFYDSTIERFDTGHWPGE